ncbi:unnamed protein product [Ceutorhynchus assimilis]|uniref:Uncharacterized protein n=1 Tax=Ceutorhynchus assimilis TaxID=467358 RepID=A0A9N9MVT1_9CUCU|nr:unnamed protein product [Ceutorhynchus assimilis]
MVKLKPPQFRNPCQVIKDWDTKNNFWSFWFYKRYYGVIPIVTLACLDVCWFTFCSIQGFIRTDVVLSRHGIKSKQQGELYDLLLHPVNRKFLTYYQTFEPNENLFSAYEQMKDAEKRVCE